jgi:hypothetical protein
MALLVLFLPFPLNAGDKEAQRIWAGLDLFPSILAADRGIGSKTGPDGKLLLVLKYSDDRSAVQEMASHLEKVTTIRAIPIRIELTKDPSFKSYNDEQVAGIFIAQKISPDFISAAIHFGQKHHVIIFSPFKGDVERGVSGGIIISDRILPYVNMETMQKSAIHLKPFFLRIAKTHE